MEFTQEIVRELLDYDPETGIVRWKERDQKWFSDNSYFSAVGMCHRWNVKYAGKEVNSRSALDYFRIAIFSKRFLLHRIIWLWMTGEWPKVIDHENGNPSDNRWENLRNVDRLENQKNMKVRSDNISGFQGVSFRSDLNKWRARIFVCGKDHHIGLFDTFDEAVSARKEAERFYNFHENHGRNDLTSK